MSKHVSVDIRVPIEKDNPSIRRIESLCISCGQCKEVCNKTISVGHHYDLLKTNDTAICINCGQCVQVCPTGSIVEIQDWMKVQRVIEGKKKKVVAITSPSVRVGLGEEFGKPAGSYVEKQMVASLRALGVDYVFDTTFAADLTIMEEASELIERIKKQEHLPQFTSCCPAWVKFVELYYPELLSNLSTSKSPISMFAPTIKTWFAKKENIQPEDIYLVAITPCTAKKAEIAREEFVDASLFNKQEAYPDCDAVVTTKELANWLRAENLDLDDVNESEYDSLMPRGSGAGIIFGNTGGVMEAAIRTSYYLLTNQEPPKDLLKLEAVRGMEGVRHAEVTIQDITIKVAVIHGTNNARSFLHHLKQTQEHYDFVEVMTCPGGCIGGGGQPKHIGQDMNKIRKDRIASLYKQDEDMTLRNSYEHPSIKQVYTEFYHQPLSELAEQLLHTSYHKRNDLNEDPTIYQTQYIQEDEKKEPTKANNDVKYKCSVCGYIYEGDINQEPEDYVCPLCGVPKTMFDLVEEEVVETKANNDVKYKCSVCGYIYEGDINQEPDDYVCPLCGVPKAMFDLVEEEVVETKASNDVKYKCSVCGYIYEGDINQEPDDYVCPLCGVPKAMFDLVEEEVVETKANNDVKYKCSVCGYIYEGDINQEPDDYVCPLCGVPKTMFDLIEDDTNTEMTRKGETKAMKYKCSVCGYIYEGDINQEPDDYVCPLCGVPKSMFDLVEE